MKDESMGYPWYYNMRGRRGVGEPGGPSEEPHAVRRTLRGRRPAAKCISVTGS